MKFQGDSVITILLYILAIGGIALIVLPSFIEGNRNATLMAKLNEAKFVCEQKRGVFGLFQPKPGDLFRAICLNKNTFDDSILDTWELK